MSEAPAPRPEDYPPISAESLVDGEAAPDDARTYPSTLGGGFYLLLLVVASVGLFLVISGSWRTGIRVFGGVLVAAALLRLALSSRDAGMLAVRSKPIDAVLLSGVGAVMIFLAGSIPDQPL